MQIKKQIYTSPLCKLFILELYRETFMVSLIFLYIQITVCLRDQENTKIVKLLIQQSYKI